MTIRTSINGPRPEDVGSFWRRMTSGGGGPSKPSRFLVVISPPRGVNSVNMLKLRDLTFQCEAAEMPGRTIETSEMQIAGPRFKIPYGTDYPDLALTFLCTNDMYEKRIFDEWMEAINNREDFTFGYRSDYSTTVSVFQYDEGNDLFGIPMITYGAQLIDAWPTAINPMPLSWGEDGVNRLGVTFTYTYFKPVGTLNSIIPRNLLNSVVGSVVGGFENVGGQVATEFSGLVNGSINGAFTGLSGFLGSLF